eukprot:m.139703 g.139703  ORF g.139703 m.139703 type:complete len:123 (-) comp14808_c0_seq1:1143-1511(-)
MASNQVTGNPKEMTVEQSEEAEKERLMVTPKLSLVQDMFMLKREESLPEEKEAATKNLMDAIKENNMAPFYDYLCTNYGVTKDVGLAKEMKSANDAELKKLEATIAGIFYQHSSNYNSLSYA